MLAGLIVHYGRSCLSVPPKTPVLFVFGRRPMDVAVCASELERLLPSTPGAPPTVVLCDVEWVPPLGRGSGARAEAPASRYEHGIEGVRQLLAHRTDLLWSTVEREHRGSGGAVAGRCGGGAAACCGGGGQEAEPEGCCGSAPAQAAEGGVDDVEVEPVAEGPASRYGRTIPFAPGVPPGEHRFFYVGPEGATLTNFMLYYSASDFFSFDPVAGKARCVNPAGPGAPSPRR